jgi:hypothetical protein
MTKSHDHTGGQDAEHCQATLVNLAMLGGESAVQDFQCLLIVIIRNDGVACSSHAGGTSFIVVPLKSRTARASR